MFLKISVKNTIDKTEVENELNEQIGWESIAQKSLEENWDNTNDEKVWVKFLIEEN